MYILKKITLIIVSVVLSLHFALSYPLSLICSANALSNDEIWTGIETTEEEAKEEAQSNGDPINSSEKYILPIICPIQIEGKDISEKNLDLLLSQCQKIDKMNSGV